MSIEKVKSTPATRNYTQKEREEQRFRQTNQQQNANKTFKQILQEKAQEKVQKPKFDVVEISKKSRDEYNKEKDERA